MRYQQNQMQNSFRRGFSAGALTAALIFGSALPALATGGENSAKKAAEKKHEDSASEAATTGRRRDPFVIPSRVKKDQPKPKVTREPQPVLPPGADMRMAEYRSTVRMAAMSNQPAPSVLSPYLIEELTINGIFKTGEGFGAFVVEGVSARRMTLFARPGLRTYDGVVKEITPTGVRFVKNIRYDDGRVMQKEMFVALSGRNTPAPVRPDNGVPNNGVIDQARPASAKTEGAATKDSAADEQRRRTDKP